MKRNPPPKGKMLLIGSEDVEVYPQYCGDGHRCIQCFFNGKYLCAPRYWLYPTLDEFYGYPVSPPKEVFKRFGSEARLPSDDKYGEVLKDSLAGQPLIPMPDGGFVAEVTNRVMSRPIFARKEPSRITDTPCYKCGYPFLRFAQSGNSSNNYRVQYSCPQCGSHQIQDTKKSPVYRIKRLLKELREQGITRKASIELISQKLGHKISSGTYIRYIKAMGLPLRKPGRRAVRKLLEGAY